MDESPKDTGFIVRASFVLAALAVIGGMVALLIGALGHSRGSEGFYSWIGISIWLLTPGACLAMLTLLVVHWPRHGRLHGSGDLDAVLEHTGQGTRR